MASFGEFIDNAFRMYQNNNNKIDSNLLHKLIDDLPKLNAKNVTSFVKNSRPEVINKAKQHLTDDNVTHLMNGKISEQDDENIQLALKAVKHVEGTDDIKEGFVIASKLNKQSLKWSDLWKHRKFLWRHRNEIRALSNGGKKRSKTRRKTKHKRKSKHKRRKHRRHSHKK